LSVLSATLIVRDEAAVLPRCLVSLRDLVDDIVVVDTGSKDGSVDIAAALGARVFHFEWRNDFSAARNFALSQARGAWILYIDADECARLLRRGALDATLNDPGLIAATVQFRSRTGFTRYQECRLFRNDPRIRFRNVIHETMVPDVHAVAHSDDLGIGTSPLALDHFGYDGNQQHKHLRNIPLLRARLARDPQHVYSWNHLGQALAGMGDMGSAVATWQHAIDVVRTIGVRSALDALPYGSLLLCPDAAATTAGLLDEALRCFPQDYLFRWLLGRRLLDDEQFAAALVLFEELAAIDAETFCSDNGVAYDVRIFGVSTCEAAALCHFRLGHYEASAWYYERASAADPHNPAHQVRKRLATARHLSTTSRENDGIGTTRSDP
jgi:tetratricopeptide (TPR) repeat protein